MLLQQIILQLDGELVRLESLRAIVADLAQPLAVPRNLPPRFDRSSRAETPVAAMVLAEPAHVQAVAAVPTQPAGPRTSAPTMRGRGRPRKLSLPGDRQPEPAERVKRASKRAEPTALSKAASAGPVVISSAALTRERQAREAAKAASPYPHPQPPEMEPEKRPEVSARELAARWLASPGRM